MVDVVISADVEKFDLNVGQMVDYLFATSYGDINYVINKTSLINFSANMDFSFVIVFKIAIQDNARWSQRSICFWDFCNFGQNSITFVRFTLISSTSSTIDFFVRSLCPVLFSGRSFDDGNDYDGKDGDDEDVDSNIDDVDVDINIGEATGDATCIVEDGAGITNWDNSELDMVSIDVESLDILSEEF